MEVERIELSSLANSLYAPTCLASPDLIDLAGRCPTTGQFTPLYLERLPERRKKPSYQGQ